jgi:protein-S-isoprenylcysteine O-methyltransferase Ste14
MQKIIAFAEKYRAGSSRILAIFLVVLIFFTHHSWEHLTVVDTLFEVIGLFLIGVCVMGRLWASVYVAGHKREELVTVGPYSLMRNPLYTFSFIGAAGISFLTENILVIITLISVFILQYYLVVLAEEHDLKKVHGEAYREYMEKVPRRFIPNFSLYIEPEQFVVNTKIYRKSFLDAIWFIWGIIPLKIIERLHELGIIPTLFHVP